MKEKNILNYIGLNLIALAIIYVPFSNSLQQITSYLSISSRYNEAIQSSGVKIPLITIIIVDLLVLSLLIYNNKK
jgi:hypothetical protein